MNFITYFILQGHFKVKNYLYIINLQTFNLNKKKRLKQVLISTTQQQEANIIFFPTCHTKILILYLKQLENNKIVIIDCIK